MQDSYYTLYLSAGDRLNSGSLESEMEGSERGTNKIVEVVEVFQILIVVVDL